MLNARVCVRGHVVRQCCLCFYGYVGTCGCAVDADDNCAKRVFLQMCLALSMQAALAAMYVDYIVGCGLLVCFEKTVWPDLPAFEIETIACDDVYPPPPLE